MVRLPIFVPSSIWTHARYISQGSVAAVEEKPCGHAKLKFGQVAGYE